MILPGATTFLPTNVVARSGNCSSGGKVRYFDGKGERKDGVVMPAMQKQFTAKET
jgi:hypothetical protein